MTNVQLKTASGQTVSVARDDRLYQQYIDGGAKEITAPVPTATPAPAPAPTAPVASTPVNTLTTSQMDTAKTPAVDAQAKMGTFVTYDEKTGLASNRRASEIGQQGANDFLETPINGADYAKDPSQYVVTNKNATTLFGFKKPVKAETPAPIAGGTNAGNANTGGTGQDGELGKTGDPIRDTIAGMYNETKDEYADAEALLSEQRENVEEISEFVKGIRTEMDKMKNDLDYNSVLQTVSTASIKNDYYEQKDKIESRPLSMGYGNALLNKLSGDTNIKLDKESLANAVTNATNTYRYNSKLIEYNVAVGDLQTAQQIAKDTATDIKEYKSEMLNLLSSVNQLDQQTREMKQADIDREYDMAMKGYTYVPNLEALNELAVKKGTEWVEQNTTKIGGKIWIKPDLSMDVASTISANGRLYGINNKGDIIKDYGSNSSFQFKENEDGTHSVFNPATGELVTTTKPETAQFDFGDGTITAYGSPAWEYGLDFVLDGGKGAPVNSPIAGEVIFAGKNGGFGNQVKIRTEQGEELWVSHLDSFNVKVGDKIEAGAFLGGQGNTGTVMGLNGQKYSPAELASGKGTHLDLTIKKADGSFYSAREVAELLGHGGVKDDALLNLQALSLLTDISPRLANNADALEIAKRAINEKGEGARDWVADQLRFSRQSPEFEEFRKIAGAALTNTPPTQRGMIEDVLDDFIESNDLPGARDYILKVARENAGAVEQKAANGREDALYAINEIDRLLKDFVAQGGSTGLIKGNLEKLEQNILKSTGNAQLASIGNEISMTIQKYRQELTGAAFTESEAKEYARLFPGIEKSPELNEALISSMRAAYTRNLDMFYQRQLGGTSNWKKLQELTADFNWGNPDFGQSKTITTNDGLKWQVDAQGNYVQIK